MLTSCDPICRLPLTRPVSLCCPCPDSSSASSPSSPASATSSHADDAPQGMLQPAFSVDGRTYFNHEVDGVKHKADDFE